MRSILFRLSLVVATVIFLGLLASNSFHEIDARSAAHSQQSEFRRDSALVADCGSGRADRDYDCLIAKDSALWHSADYRSAAPGEWRWALTLALPLAALALFFVGSWIVTGSLRERLANDLRDGPGEQERA